MGIKNKTRKLKVEENDLEMNQKYMSDVETILSHRYDNGADYWTTTDHKLLKGAPYTTLESASYLLELGVPSDDEVLKKSQNLFSAAGKKTAESKPLQPAEFIPAIPLWL